MRPGRAADHSPPSSAAVMEEKIYTSTHPLGHTGPVTGSLYHFTTVTNKSCLDLIHFELREVWVDSHIFFLFVTFQYKSRLSLLESLQKEPFCSFCCLAHFTLYHDTYVHSCSPY